MLEYLPIALDFVDMIPNLYGVASARNRETPGR
jgi:hypothetical protein